MESQILSLAFVLVVSSCFIIILSKRKNKSKPGPRLPPSPWALPIVGHMHLLRPLVHQAFRDLSVEYGPLMHLRLGSVNLVVASTPHLAKELLKTHELSYSSRKMNIAINLVTYDNATFAFAPYGTYWKYIRKLSTKELLGARTIRQFLPGRAREIHGFILGLTEKSMGRESVNLTQELLKLSNNIISHMMLGIKSSGTDNQAEEARSLVREVTQIFGEFNVSDFIKLCKNVDFGGFKKRAMDIHKRYDGFLERILCHRESLRSNRKLNGDVDGGGEKVRDFLDILLDAAEDNNAEVTLTRNNIKSVILDYLTAATDTSAISMEWAIAELINNPRVLKRAQEEVDKVTEGKRKRLISEFDIPNLPYINAIIKETMRLHPPIPMVTRKGTQDCVVNGFLIPKGTILFINIWAMGRDPNIWDNPLEFRPERFLEGKGSGIDMKGHNYELLPFGSGRRGCPGQPLALQELPLVIGAMIQCFTWKPLDLQGKVVPEGTTIEMSERPGLTAPRTNDLHCIPVTRFNPIPILHF